MEPYIVLNELSCGDAFDARLMERVMVEFCDVLKTLRAKRPGASFVTPVRMQHLTLGREYNVSQWLKDPSNLDRWRMIRSMQQRAPVTFDELSNATTATEIEYRYKGELSVGLGIAHYTSGLAISFATSPEWDNPTVELTLAKLVPQGTDVVLTELPVNVRHASRIQHVREHADRWRRAGLDGIESGADIWERRKDLFPSLQFLPRVEHQLRALEQSWVGPVSRSLADIEDATAAWDPTASKFPVWAGVTPESQTRKELCRFTDLDGETRLFDLHGRFTPGHGRIHLRLVQEEARARIAHIGRKIGI